MDITAIINKICKSLPVAKPAIIPKIPSNQIIMQITATNQRIPRIIYKIIFQD
jgi:hypothetical protein